MTHPANPIGADLASLAIAQHGLFTRSQVRSLGMSTKAIERRVTRREWIAVDHGVYRAATTPATWHQRLLAACLAGPAVASHRAAAALLGPPGFSGAPVEVTSRRHLRRKAPDVIWHESLHLDEVDLTERAGIPTTNPARTFVDLATVLDDSGLLRVYDDLVRRRMVTAVQIVGTLERLGPRRHGASRVRSILDRRRDGGVPESVLETELEELLARYGLPRPVRQLEVHDDEGFVARLDFAYPSAMVDIEVDGAQWHSSTDARTADRRRDERLARLGWMALRFTAWDIRFRPEWVAIEIRQALHDRGGLNATVG